MNDYWEEAPAPGFLAEEFPESGRPGCLSVFAVLLAVSGLVYGAIFGFLGFDLITEQPGQLAQGVIVTLAAGGGSLLTVILAVGLWRLRMWAWWLAVIVQSLGIGLALLSFVVALLGMDPTRALGFVLGPLMGLVASSIILYWFLTNRDRFGQGDVVRTGEKVTEDLAPGRDV